MLGVGGPPSGQQGAQLRIPGPEPHGSLCCPHGTQQAGPRIPTQRHKQEPETLRVNIHKCPEDFKKAQWNEGV